MTEDVWDREKRFWLEGLEFYKNNMSDSCTMVFPKPPGIMRGQNILNSLKNAPRWTNVTLSKKQVFLKTDSTIGIAYEATAERDEQTYHVLCSSVYIIDEEQWRICQHQQTPTKS